MEGKYNPNEIETKWQKFWAKNQDLDKAQNGSGKPKKYILDMFPYPSGDGLHTGHVESYTATDIISRYLRMKGFKVLHPQGFDAFGLPAENFAIKTKVHPSETTKKAIATFTKQMKMMGFSYDWERRVITSDPEYYKWTQWFFLLLYKNGLAYKKKAKVNWCESCQTVLANEQAENGICERCKNPVIQKNLEQWFFKITDFIENKEKTKGLISGLEKVDWPESTKSAQVNWIGKSVGTEFKMQIENSDKFIEVYTTRIDTVFGVTYAVIAPEYKIISELKDKIQNWDEVEKYISASKKKTDLDRMEAKEKAGVELKGVRVTNPFNNIAVPLFVADYVLGHYGTGAVMAVPAHDERDFEFAKKYNLEIKGVIFPKSIKSGLLIDDVEKKYEQFKKETEKFILDIWKGNKVFIEDGKLWDNSKKYSQLTSQEAREKMTTWLEKKGIGKKKINYKLRDWLVSRQRYWGAPIPIIYCEKCGEVPVPEKDLPVELPNDVDFKPTGESPLVHSKKFHDVKCPKCGAKARRESDTMDTFVCSSWYYFRYADPKNEKEFASKEMLKKWLPVDLYVGGAEHSVLHLLYARFFTKVLHNFGYIDFDEPFSRLRHQGIILAEDGRKMSKSLGNVVNPDDVVKKYGADSLRMFEMFMGPLEDAKPWNTKGIIGIYRFLNNTYNYLDSVRNFYGEEWFNKWISGEISGGTLPKTENLFNKTVKKVTEDIDNLRFNTAISQLMILRNSFHEFLKDEYFKHGEIISKENFEKFIIILSPFAPHLAEELWEKLGHKESIFKKKWPEYDPKLIVDEEFELIVQISGKVRDKIKAKMDISENEAKDLAMQSEKIKNNIQGKEIRKVIFVKNRLINIVV